MSQFEKNVIQIWGDKGNEWLKSLPHVARLLADQWHLTDLVPANNLTYNYILLGYQDKTPIALKIGFEDTQIKQEALALQHYQGHGSIRLLDQDSTHNALLLERAIPGTSLKQFFPDRDDAAMQHAVVIMNQLHAIPAAVDANFAHVEDWLNVFEEPHAGLSKKHIHKARELANYLLATQQPSVVLHGDLHHDNILMSDRGWIAIDPKGVIGEPAYEVGAFVRNPYPELLQQSDPQAIMWHRIKQFADLLSIDEVRLQQWSYVQAVMAACWAMNDGSSDPKLAMAEAELLDLE